MLSYRTLPRSSSPYYSRYHDDTTVFKPFDPRKPSLMVALLTLASDALSFPQVELLKVEPFSLPTSVHDIQSLGAVKCFGHLAIFCTLFVSNIRVAD